MSILRDPSAVVIRFAQLEFALTGELSDSQEYIGFKRNIF